MPSTGVQEYPEIAPSTAPYIPTPTCVLGSLWQQLGRKEPLHPGPAAVPPGLSPPHPLPPSCPTTIVTLELLPRAWAPFTDIVWPSIGGLLTPNG